jgi:hypothetical protein
MTFLLFRTSLRFFESFTFAVKYVIPCRLKYLAVVQITWLNYGAMWQRLHHNLKVMTQLREAVVSVAVLQYMSIIFVFHHQAYQCYSFV